MSRVALVSRWSLCCASLLLSWGCQPHPSIEGTVTFNGQPVEKGAISFRPADGRGPSFGAMIVDGKYHVARATTGAKIAVITAIDEGPIVASREEAMQRIREAEAAGRPAFEAVQVDIIPAGAAGNHVPVEIQPTAQTIDFDVTAPDEAAGPQ